MNYKFEHIRPMKRFAILVFVLAMALSAFAQADVQIATQSADSCNMSLVDEWVCTVDDYVGFNNTGIEICENFVLATIDKRLIVLEIDASGNLTFLDSIIGVANDVAVKDSFCYILQTNFFTSSDLMIYKVSNEETFDSITTISFDEEMMQLFIEDTLLYGYDYESVFTVYNISDPTSPTLIGSSSLTASVMSPTGFYAQYPYVYIGGQQYFGEPHFEWYQGELLVMDISNIDSTFTKVHRYSEHGGIGYPSRYSTISVSDSIVYAIGSNHLIESFNFDKTSNELNYIGSYEDSATSGKFSIIKNNSLIICAGLHIQVFNISSYDTIILTNYYNFAGAPDPVYSFIHEELCIIDSFIITLGTQYRGDTVKVSVLKYDEGASGINCGYNQKPESFDFDVYPNPFNSICNIELASSSSQINGVSIFNIQGKQVADYPNTSDNSICWDASEEATGVYLVKINTGQSQLSKKIIYMK